MTRIVFFDPVGGVSGDMFSAAFLDAGLVTRDELEGVVRKVLADITLLEEKEVRCGIHGSRLRVISSVGEELISHAHSLPEPGHDHHPFKDIQKLIESSELESPVKELVLSIFEALAKAEAKVHGKTVNEVHFHEVGRNDAVADIVCAAYCVKKMGAARFVCSPVPIGQGTITFSHGTMPTPAPATLELLKGIPIVSGYPVGEMTTPTGAAIIVSCCRDFQPFVSMVPAVIGYGHGTRNPKGYPSSFRIVVGNAMNHGTEEMDYDEVVEVKTNIDDQPPTVLAPALERLLSEGALDVFVAPYLGKKSRQGQEWTVLVKPGEEKHIAAVMLRELGTIGVRMGRRARYKLYREETHLMVEGQPVRAKRVFGAGVDRVYPEMDDLVKLAQLKGIPLSEIVERTFRQNE